MKYLKRFLEKQLSLFPQEEIPKVQDTVRKFVQRYKVQSQEPRTKDYETIDSLLKTYDNRDKFNEICGRMVNESEMIDHYEIDKAVRSYFIDNNDILLQYIKDEGYGQYFNDEFDNMKENDDVEEDADIDDYVEEICNDYLRKTNDITIDKIDDDELITDGDSFIDYIKDNYSGELDYHESLDISYWDDLIDAFRYSEFADDNKIAIYRRLRIPKKMEDLEKEMEDYSGVGSYWTYEEEKAEAYCAAGDYRCAEEITIKAYVKVEDIDAETTFERAVYSLKEEREIKVVPGSVVELFGIHLHGKEEDLYDNKRYLIKYFEEAYGFDWDKMSKIRRDYKKEASEKSEMVFNPPLKIKV